MPLPSCCVTSCGFLFRSPKCFFYPHDNELLMVWERPWLRPRVNIVLYILYIS